MRSTRHSIRVEGRNDDLVCSSGPALNREKKRNGKAHYLLKMRDVFMKRPSFVLAARDDVHAV